MQNKIEKSPSLKSGEVDQLKTKIFMPIKCFPSTVKMLPLSTILGSSSTHASMSSINLQTIPEENRKNGSETEQDHR